MAPSRRSHLCRSRSRPPPQPKDRDRPATPVQVGRARVRTCREAAPAPVSIPSAGTPATSFSSRAASEDPATRPGPVPNTSAVCGVDGPSHYLVSPIGAHQPFWALNAVDIAVCSCVERRVARRVAEHVERYCRGAEVGLRVGDGTLVAHRHKGHDIRPGRPVSDEGVDVTKATSPARWGPFASSTRSRSSPEVENARSRSSERRVKVSAAEPGGDGDHPRTSRVDSDATHKAVAT